MGAWRAATRRDLCWASCTGTSVAQGEQIQHGDSVCSVQEDCVTEANVLLVNTEAQFVSAMTTGLVARSMEVFSSGSCDEAMHQLAVHAEIEVVLLDACMSACNPTETLKLIRQRHPLVEVIMLADRITVETAIDCIRLGAADYVMKPCDIEVLTVKVREAVDKKRRHEEKIVEARVREIANRVD